MAQTVAVTHQALIDAGKYTESEAESYRNQSCLTVKPIFKDVA